MVIELKREFEVSRFLDAANNFQEKVFTIELRTDPLTKEFGSVATWRFRKLEKPDLSAYVSKSMEMGCPFCPGTLETTTPKFTPDFWPGGRIKVGQAIAFPNSMPYMYYNALAAMGSRHFVTVNEFNEGDLADGFIAAQIYFKRVLEYDLRAEYHIINWNYLPPASSSQVHPHLQIVASYAPLTYHRMMLEASQEYYAQCGTNYWADLTAEERRLGERYIGTVGNTVWVTSFLPRAWLMDITVIFQNKASFTSLSANDISDFCSGLNQLFAYMHDQNYYSFNLALYSGLEKENSFWTHARIIQRAAFPPIGLSDCSGVRLLHDTMSIVKSPEEVQQELNPYFS